MTDRIYVAQIENVAVAAVQDVFSLLATANAGIMIHHIMLGALGQTSAVEWRLSLKRLPATVTQGTGGTAPTKNALDSSIGSITSVVTARANDVTTQSTTNAGGGAATLLSWTWNVLLPFEYYPAPEHRPVCGTSQAFALTLNAAPAASTNVSGFIKWEEFP